MLRPGLHSPFHLIPKVLNGSVWASQVLRQQTRKIIILWTWLSAQWHHHVEAHYCLKYNLML